MVSNHNIKYSFTLCTSFLLFSHPSDCFKVNHSNACALTLHFPPSAVGKNGNLSFYSESTHTCFLQMRRFFHVLFIILLFYLWIILEYIRFISFNYFIPKILFKFKFFEQILTIFQVTLCSTLVEHWFAHIFYFCSHSST